MSAERLDNEAGDSDALPAVVAGFFTDPALSLGEAWDKIAGMSEWELQEGVFALLTLLRVKDVREADLEKQMKKLAELANRDYLTGLPNRRWLEADYLSRANRSQRIGDPAPSGQMLVIDLDKFKEANDTYGHDAGDQILQLVGRGLAASLREGDVIARTGGDEFTALVRANRRETDQLTVRLRSTVAEHLAVVGFPEDVTTLSIGAAFTHYREPFGAVYREADAAMYRAKEAGGDQLVHAR